MLFGKNSRLAPEERRERVQAIERLINADKDDEVFRLTQALEKEDGSAAGLAMACFYTMGENVGEDHTAAALRAPKEGLFRPVRLKERGGRGALPNIIYDDGNDRRQLRRRNGDGREVLIRLNCVSDATANTGEGTFHWH